MQNTNQRETLTNLLQTLKRNLDFMPREQLKCKYSQGYQQLCKKISSVLESYVKSIIFSDIRIRPDYAPEAIQIINQSLQTSNFTKQVSKAAFDHQSIEEISRLAADFHIQLQKDLMPLYCSHISLILTPECLEDPASAPLIYSNVNNSFYINNTWIEAGHIPQK